MPDTNIYMATASRCRCGKFTQVDATGKRRHEGTGLGLHLSEKLAELLGGQITFQSEFGHGSTFTLILKEG